VSPEELHQVVTGRTRVRHTPTGDFDTVISPLPDGIRSRDRANLIVQFDGEDVRCSVTSTALGGCPVTTWSAPETPGPEVTAVRDRHGVIWHHDVEVWWGDIGHGYDDHRTWNELLARGPLTDASEEEP
jgi:hypothetical protein